MQIYTTKLDRGSKDFKKNERMAEKIAGEIMHQTSSNFHMQEVRWHLKKIFL